jgi:hypothetical protein
MARRNKASRAEKPPLQDFGEGIFVSKYVSPNHERLLGRLVVAWSRLEAVMGDLIWVILGVDAEDGRVITARMDARTKLQWLRVYLKRCLSEDSFAECLKTLDKIQQRQEDRNFAMHGSWGTSRLDNASYGDPIAFSLRASSAPDKVVSETFPRGRMYEIIDDIEACRRELFIWRKRIQVQDD